MYKRSLTAASALTALSLLGAACSQAPVNTPAANTPQPVTNTNAPAVVIPPSTNVNTPSGLTPPVTNTNSPAVVTPPARQPKTVTITMTNDGFTPSQVTIAKGDTVTFVNNGTKPIWPASAPHPTHTNYPEFDADRGIAPGSSWSFTFTRVGSWGFHDHLNAQHFGKVIVTE